MENNLPLSEGAFVFGANYWASHVGTNMWREWDENAVEEDFCRFAKSGLRLLRIFPLWSDFQPIKAMFNYANREHSVYYENENYLPNTPEGKAGVDPVMIERFDRVCKLAKKHGISLIIGLITGWMSGRMHSPRLLERCNVLKDAVAIKWEIRFVQYMVRRFKEEPAIIAWELGNECNCMGTVSRDEAFLWSKSIAMAVKEIDPDRPMLSGMHGVFPGASFDVRDQGEITDMLTTHPYPLFTPHCNTDSMITMKSALHASCESLMYQGIGGKPCFIEEAGNLGPMVASDENTAHYVVASAMTAWAHRLRSYVWWCMNEQSHLTHPPYQWIGLERELGLFDAKKEPKPVLTAMGKMQKYFDEFPVSITDPLTDAVCILTRGDSWTVAYGAFLLAKQTGLDLKFTYVTEDIPEASVYFLPSLSGDQAFYTYEFAPVIDRVKHGATLYMSWADAILSPFEEYVGARPLYRTSNPDSATVTLNGEAISLSRPVTMKLELTEAEAILSSDCGEPILTKHSLGEGTVYFASYPIEKIAASVANASQTQLYRIYELLNVRNATRVAEKEDSHLGLTEHILDDGRRLLVLINYQSEEKEATVTLKDGYTVDSFLPYDNSSRLCYESEKISLKIARNSGAAIIIKQ